MSKLVIRSGIESLLRFAKDISAKVHIVTLTSSVCVSVGGHPPPIGLTYHSEQLLTIYFTVLPFRPSSFSTVPSGPTKLL